MESWKRMLEGRKANSKRKARKRRGAHRGPQSAAAIEALESRVLLAASTLYQVPVTVTASTQPTRPQNIAKVGMAPDGDFVAVWEDVFSTTETNVVFRRFNSNGTPIDAAQRVTAGSALDERSVDVGVAADGSFVIVWQGRTSDPGNSTYDIYFQRYDALGNAAGSATRVNTSNVATGEQLDPTIAVADNGTFIVAWQDSANNGDIAYRRFAANGTAVDGADVFVAATARTEMEVDLAVNAANGDFVIVWTDDDGTDRDVWYQARLANGTIRTTARANVTDAGANDFQDRPSVAIDNSSEFVIVWEDVEPGSSINDVRFRRFLATGVAKDAADQTVVATQGVDEGDPVVAINGDGSRFVVAYESGTRDIFFKVFDGTGSVVVNSSEVNASNPVRDVAVAMNALGDFVMVQTQGTGDSPPPDVVAATLVRRTTRSAVVTAPDAGGGPMVRVLDPDTGLEGLRIFAYPGFLGGVRVATADINNDGFPDIITAPGAGHSPTIRIFNGADGNLMGEFLAYGAGMTGGVYIAAGDINNDGTPDIVTGTGAGGGPMVRIFSGVDFSELFVLPGNERLFAYSPTYLGGVKVAVGDVTGDNRVDIVTGTGPGGGPMVRIFSGVDGSEVFLPGPGERIFAYSPTFLGGFHVSVGDMNNDGRAEILTGTGEGGGPLVRVFNGLDGSVLASFQAYSPYNGGVKVATGDVDGDGQMEIITGTGPTFGPMVRFFELDGSELLGDDQQRLIAYAGQLHSGVFVAGQSWGQAGEGSPLTVDRSVPPANGTPTVVSQPELAPVVSAATERLEDAGVPADLLASLATVQFTVANLGGNLLGLARPGIIVLDDDAAGYGWFVDYSPLLDEEFFGDGSTLAALDGRAAGRVDLLTVVLHEMGHALGLDHTDSDGLMSATLAAGIRRLPTSEDLDALFASGDLLEAVV